MTQRLATATRNSIDSATLLNHIYQNHFFHNPDSGTLDAGLIDHCVTAVKLPFFRSKHDDGETTYEASPPKYKFKARQVYCLEPYS